MSSSEEFITASGYAQASAYCASRQTRVLTIFFSDLVGSTDQQSVLGNLRASELVQRHRSLFRSVLGALDGQEVETAGDSFLAVFAAPSEGVKFALRLQWAMASARAEDPELPTVRIGLHQGQVVVVEHEDGPKALDIYGLQVSTAARIMDLAQGGQVLCSRSVFDDARAILTAADFPGMGPIAWRNHGAYRFKGVEGAYEVCEAGEADLAPLSAPPAGAKAWPEDGGDEVPGWRPAVGVQVPHTSWILEERLGREAQPSPGPLSFRGAFGEVWRARNTADKSEQVFKFCFKREQLPALKREARLLKRLKSHRHPHLVEVFDVTEGERPPHYLEMAYVRGPSLREWLASAPPLAERLEVIAQVADALDTVHREGIYHRDIKPSNILLEEREGGKVLAKLSDFGLGAAEDRELLQSIYASRVEGFAGTWDYLAPELRQNGRPSPQSDLYSLGLTLFQVVISDLNRVRPSELDKAIADEILREDIAKCLKDDPAERWQSAMELAIALRSHQERTQQRVALAEQARLRTRAKRLRVALSIAVAIAALSALLGGAAAWQWREAEQQRSAAEAARDEAEFERLAAEKARNEAEAQRSAAEAARERETAQREQAEAAEQQALAARDSEAQARAELDQKVTALREADYVSAIRLAEGHIQRSEMALARARLMEAPEEHRNWAWGYLYTQLDRSVATLAGHTNRVTRADFSPDGTHILTTSDDRTAKVWDAASGELLFSLEGHFGEMHYASFSPDGTRIVTASADQTAKVWDAASGELLVSIEGHTGKVTSADFSPDGSHIVTASADQTAKVWDAASGELLVSIEGHTGGVNSVAFSPDGARIHTASNDGTAKVWDTASGEQLFTAGSGEFIHESNRVSRQYGLDSASFSPDGNQIVTTSTDTTAKVWDTATGELIVTLEGHVSGLTDASFSPDGTRIVTASNDRTTKVWHTKSGELLSSLEGHTERVTSASFSPDGARILTASYDQTAKLWDAASGKWLVSAEGHHYLVDSAAFSPDGARIVTVGMTFSSLGDRVMVWDANLGRLLLSLEGHSDGVRNASFSPDGGRILTVSSSDRTARVFDTESGELLVWVGRDTSEVRNASFSPDGARIVTTGLDKTAKVWDAASGKLLVTLEGHTESVMSADFSPDGARIVTTSRDRTAKVWDAASGDLLSSLEGHTGWVTSAAFSPDGTRILAASEDRTAKVWDAASGKLLVTLEGHTESVMSADFSPDGTRILTTSVDRTAKVWDAASGELLVTLEGHVSLVRTASFSPDGAHIVTVSGDGTAKVWSAVSGKLIVSLEGHTESVVSAAFSPDGTRILTVSGDMTAKVWDAAPWKSETWYDDATRPELIRLVRRQTPELIAIHPRPEAEAGKPLSGAETAADWIGALVAAQAAGAFREIPGQGVWVQDASALADLFGAYFEDEDLIIGVEGASVDTVQDILDAFELNEKKSTEVPERSRSVRIDVVNRYDRKLLTIGLPGVVEKEIYVNRALAMSFFRVRDRKIKEWAESYMLKEALNFSFVRVYAYWLGANPAKFFGLLGGERFIFINGKSTEEAQHLLEVWEELLQQIERDEISTIPFTFYSESSMQYININVTLK